MMDHCGWQEKIIAKYSNNLTKAECEALDEHVVICSECARVMKEFEELAINLSPLKDNTSITQLPARALVLKDKIAQKAREKTQNNLMAGYIINASLRTQESETSGDKYLRITKGEFEKIHFTQEMPWEQKAIEQGIPINTLSKTLHNANKQSFPNQVGITLSGMGFGSMLLLNILLLPIDFTIVFRFFPLFATSLPILFLLMIIRRYKFLIRRYRFLKGNKELCSLR